MSTHADEVRRIVNQLDETRRSEYFRNPDRPDGRIRGRRQRQSPEVIKAKSRIRVAHWRNVQDERRAPTTAQIGAALVAALALSGRINTLSPDEPGIVGAMLTDLRQRGFDMNELVATMQRLRVRLQAARNDVHGAGGSGPR